MSGASVGEQFIDPVVSSTSMMSVLTKFCSAWHVTDSGMLAKPKIFMIALGIVVDAAMVMTPTSGWPTVGVKAATP